MGFNFGFRLKTHLVKGKESLDLPDSVRLLLQVVAGREVAEPDGQLKVFVDQQLRHLLRRRHHLEKPDLCKKEVQIRKIISWTQIILDPEPLSSREEPCGVSMYASYKIAQTYITTRFLMER